MPGFTVKQKYLHFIQANGQRLWLKITIHRYIWGYVKYIQIYCPKMLRAIGFHLWHFMYLWWILHSPGLKTRIKIHWTTLPSAELLLSSTPIRHCEIQHNANITYEGFSSFQSSPYLIIDTSWSKRQTVDSRQGQERHPDRKTTCKFSFGIHPHFKTNSNRSSSTKVSDAGEPFVPPRKSVRNWAKEKGAAWTMRRIIMSIVGVWTIDHEPNYT